ncbi:4-hydroxy-tetrahydrodipicolinate synthase [Rhizobium leguminosarum]|uniref:4-hydroxy-tetrahydrodipicolinate synthase n=1 Tax=Rhizobium leguminosarum TaxID=384 RepID=A0AAE2MN16_RHILE|nr:MULTISPECIES: 4-hydroxy-tetrahydrodipicolinate synthase [Rhizobium]MBB4292382.1 4-hydroxy-tetrahydrodipicolinate synthase [Rhizobium leguminosarum]MBB4298620.1 4-hydroxy-tetrahydrodipicolinate synthase [Rhizobium leguminosarum]MBB4310406.1 4-hydroxy-tetrahydrodipicolinate synthase [Rhizobium leguminosarum]MBB4434668.1 4-hydroxy-tetrahydrodipicolinate synthase [Rhizobium esperanzae]MBB4531564.1 4-hydroxy-tetrahydrodipicolinate synthase [Rhizobium leguminosarum]
MFKGSITALVTPFADGRVDEVALRGLIEWQIEEGSSGLVPCGTTGESPTLSHAEHKQVVELTIETAKGRVPVIAGAGSNSTDEAIDFVHHAQQAGADGLLIVSPYYNKPTQEGIYQHFKAIDAEANIPIIVYNIPGRSVIDIQVETLARIFKDCPNVKGVKDATGNLLRPSLERIACGKDFNLLTGEDGTALGYMAHGGHGCISVTANIAPRLCADFQNACLNGDFASALELQDRLMPLHQALFLETNPAGPKYALHRLGRMHGDLRLPLVTVSRSVQDEIDCAMRHAGVLA